MGSKVRIFLATSLLVVPLFASAEALGEPIRVYEISMLERGRLGVWDIKSTLIVASVPPAHKVLRAGDIVLHVGNTPTQTITDLNSALQDAAQSGRHPALGIFRHREALPSVTPPNPFVRASREEDFATVTFGKGAARTRAGDTSLKPPDRATLVNYAYKFESLMAAMRKVGPSGEICMRLQRRKWLRRGTPVGTSLVAARR
jgi:hypothetical protein